MPGLAIDTHSFVWYVVEPERLSKEAHRRMEAEVAGGRTLKVATVSLVELTYLVEKERRTAEPGNPVSSLSLRPCTPRLSRGSAFRPKWLGLQAEYDLRVARREVGAEVERVVQRHSA